MHSEIIESEQKQIINKKLQEWIDNKIKTVLNPIKNDIEQEINSSDLRLITYQTLLEKFNSKHSNLNYPQKSLLRAYINNVSNVNSLKEYIEKVVPAIKRELKQHSNKLTDKLFTIIKYIPPPLHTHTL